MPTQWKCPDPDCPPTGYPPPDVTTFETGVPTEACAGCSKTYPKGTVKRITTP
jgi:hypothetical protein